MGFFGDISQILKENSARHHAPHDAALNNAAAFIDRAKSDGLGSAVGDAISNSLGLTPEGEGDDAAPKFKTPTDSAWSYSGSPVPPQQLDYINAELAKHYRMDVNTAYQEALANTAYQREVKDMKAAGLNPAVLYGGGRGGNGADSFRGSSAASGGSGGGSSRRSGRSSNSGKNLFSNGEYYGISTAVGLATAAITKNPGNYWLGANAAQGVLTAISGFWKDRR